jgi:RNA polymerase sigma-70 factor, ECF subfamily
MPSMEDQDRQLVGRLKAGDESGFQEFFDEYFDRLYRFAMSRTRGNADMAEEAVQRTLIRALRGLEGFRGESALFTWLVQICRNELADLGQLARRDASRTVSFDADERLRERVESVVTDPRSDPAAAPEADERAQLLREVLDGLPGRYGEVLEWKYLEEMSVEQIAQRLRASFESTQSLLQRARVALRSALAERGIDAAWFSGR